MSHNPPQEFTHLVLTRFNTAIGYAPSALRLDTDWLKGRLSLFEQFCLPSVASQRGAQFRWLVFYDAASPGWLRDTVKSYGSVMTPIFMEGIATDELIARQVANTGSVSTKYLVTTRLDNDDALAKNHLALIQQAFRRQAREFLAFPWGLQLFRGHVYDVCWVSNPFLSLVERVKDDNRFTTVLCVPHDHACDSGPVKRLFHSPQWLQVLHSSNIGNALRGIPRLKSRSHSNFDVQWSRGGETDSLMKRVKWSTSAYGGRADRLFQKTIAKFT